MEQREPPGISPAEGRPRDPAAATPSLRRLARLVPPNEAGGLGPGRLVGMVAATSCALVVLAVAFAEAWRGWVRAVDRQPAYQLSYREIDLKPPPPPWFRAGASGFLEGALGGSGEFQSFSSLGFDRERLILRFRRYAWVEKVLRVEVGYANRVTVRLQYREPVAVEELPGGAERTVVDREGVVLPRDDLDLDLAGPIVRLYGFSPPADPRAGQSWSRADPGQGLTAPDERVRSAARLAAFLRSELLRAPAGDPSYRFFVHPWGLDGSTVQVGANLMFLWDEPGNGDEAGRLTDAAKWAMLRDRVRRSPPRPGDPRADLRFTRDGVVPAARRAAPEQATAPDPGRPVRPAN
jgi:hypothetical protein